VIGGEKNHRVIEVAAPLDRGEYLADHVVDEGDLSGVVGPGGGGKLRRYERVLLVDPLERGRRAGGGPLVPGRGRGHVAWVVHRGVGLGGVIGRVRAVEADPAKPWLEPVVARDVARGPTADPHVAVELEGEPVGSDVRRATLVPVGLEVAAEGVPEPPALELPGELAVEDAVAAGPARLDDVVEAGAVHERDGLGEL
jgi:hypothetical protein